MNHTPTPWSRNIKPASKYPTIWSGRNTHVAYVKSGGGLLETEVEANMEFIIKAVNSYQAMKEALEMVLTRSQEPEGWGDDVDRDSDVVEMCARALTLANGKDKEP